MCNLIKLIVLFLLLLILSFKTQAEYRDSSSRNGFLMQISGLELGGYASLNIEKKLLQLSVFDFYGRAGIGSFQLKDFTGRINPDFLMPFLFYVRSGKRLRPELGLGSVFSGIVAYDPERLRSRVYSLSPCASLGLVIESPSNPLFFRFAYTPILEESRFVRHYGGIALGYRFR